jgi:hypothetical protein
MYSLNINDYQVVSIDTSVCETPSLNRPRNKHNSTYYGNEVASSSFSALDRHMINADSLTVICKAIV